ncbi:MAG: tRNA preQ1(34) S-adenosylmethionine ribosyltransferase-isomerase QueA [bacterium]|nr:tRNA preQ1(34) S-adenosylmethionine ribosyltransferase-isomerase QueA [bacterium]
MNKKDYSYYLPGKNLALKPAVPRDSSKLFVYDTQKDKIILDKFFDLDKYIPKESFLVLNDTKVLPARITMTKESGGKVVVLLLVNEIDGNIVPALVDRKINVGEFLNFSTGEVLRIKNQEENIFNLEFKFDRQKLFSILEKSGTMPIPPYLKKTSLSRDELVRKYQTIFAHNKGSSAAPTASLHFTDNVFARLKSKGIEKYFVTLHVGLGTFAPLSDENLEKKKLHKEYYEVDETTLRLIEASKSRGRKLISVGTTVTRTLESWAYTGLQKDKTDLFIYPPHDFKMVDGLLTNFHLPESSLMMLVEAFLQYKGAKKTLVELYKTAIDNDFRFYSFGDAMLIV